MGHHTPALIRFSVPIALGCALLFVPIIAHAQAPSDRAAIARQLFDEGRALMAAKDHRAACQKFEESQKLDAGGGTLLNLALCHELLGKTATAWAEYHEALRIAENDGRSDREDFAKQHIAELTPRLSRLKIIVAAGARVSGLIVLRNGSELGQGSWDVAIPVDPGLQIIEVTAPGKLPMRRELRVAPDGDLQELVIEPLKDAPRAPEKRVSSVEQTQPRPAPDGSSGRVQRISGGAVAAVGLIAAAIGGYVGLRAISLDKQSDEKCPDKETEYCRAAAFDLSRDATTLGNWSTGLFIAGGVLIGAGTFLYLDAMPKQPSTTGKFGIRLTGEF